MTRPTIYNYLSVLETTHAVTLLRPYSKGGRRELVAQPKAYGFDTGFVAFARGYTDLRNDDCGPLFEHLVLETLQSISTIGSIQFWRDKQHREVDFVIPKGRNALDAIECKWNPDGFETRNLRAFREQYPNGRNFVVSPLVPSSYEIAKDNLKAHVVDVSGLREIYIRQ